MPHTRKYFDVTPVDDRRRWCFAFYASYVAAINCAPCARYPCQTWMFTFLSFFIWHIVLETGNCSTFHSGCTFVRIALRSILSFVILCVLFLQRYCFSDGPRWVERTSVALFTWLNCWFDVDEQLYSPNSNLYKVQVCSQSMLRVLCCFVSHNLCVCAWINVFLCGSFDEFNKIQTNYGQTKCFSLCQFRSCQWFLCVSA